MWKSLRNILSAPSVDSDDLKRRLEQVYADLPAPIFWLLGKTQSGKTAIVHALTGQERAHIGNGYQPCTSSSSIYHFPDKGDCLIRFLDTRGIGEVNYDAQDDLQVFAEQSHVLIVVMKVMDPAQDTVIESLRSILAKRPEWNVIVAQTCLHEGYADVRDQHVKPYPFLTPGEIDRLPTGLVRAMRFQQTMFEQADIRARFVPLDFTLPDDGYEPVLYGMDAFWNALEHALPAGVASLLRDAKEAREQITDLYSSAVHPHIVGYSVAAGMAGAVPIPFFDMPVVTAIQFKLFQTIASAYQQPLSRQRLKDIGSAVGLGFLGNVGKRQLIKMIPAYGAAAASVLSAATTFALGKTLDAYFCHCMRGDPLDHEVYQALYRQQLEKGKSLLKSTMDARNKQA